MEKFIIISDFVANKEKITEYFITKLYFAFQLKLVYHLFKWFSIHWCYLHVEIEIHVAFDNSSNIFSIENIPVGND